MGLPVSSNWKRDIYDSILIIVDRLTKIVYYESVKVTIDVARLAEVIIDIVVWHHGLLDLIVMDKGLLFTSKFWLSLCYFLNIKRRLSPAFYPQTNGQTKKQNSIIEVYLRAFINFEQNDWASYYPWPNLPTIMLRMLALVTRHFSWTTVIIPECFMNKILILDSNRSQLMIYCQNLKNSWPFVMRISSMLKNFKNEPTIKAQSLEAILRVTRFG